VNRRQTLVRALAVATALAAFAAAGYAAEGGIQLPTSPHPPSGPDLTLLKPIEDVLSGRPWLMLNGKDPRLDAAIKRESEGGGEGDSPADSRAALAGTSSAPVTQAAGGFLVPFRNPAPAFSRGILITRDYSDFPIQTEPHVAVDPADPDHVVVATIDYNAPSNTSYVTYDGGVTWDGPNQIGYLPEDLGSGGDPVLAFDRKGNLYQASISIGVEEFSVGPVFTSSLVSAIAIARSTDGGYTWPSIISTARSNVTITGQSIDPQGRLRGSVQIGFLDKPWMSIGRSPTRADADSIYVGYVEFIEYYDIIYTGELPILLPREVASTIKIVRSDDQGKTWTDPVSASPTIRRAYGESQGGGLPGVSNEDRTLQGPRPQVLPDGTLVVGWLDTTDDGTMKGLAEIDVSRSTDGGKTYSTPATAVVFNEIPFRPRNGFFRYWATGFPKMATAANGDLYLLYTGRPAEKPRDDGDIYFIKSTDKGTSWTKPLRLNDDEGTALQFFPEITVGPDGVIHAMWADMRDDPSQVRYNIYYTRSTDGGKTWGFEDKTLGYSAKDTRVTDFGSNPNRGFPGGQFLGDYMGIAASSSDVYMVWPDTRLADFGGYNQKIGFARQRAIKAPDIFISPSSGAGGQSVTVQGFNFQPQMNVMIQLQDAVIAASRTNQDGRFTATIYMPVTGEGAQAVRVFDESGNLASSSYYTDFGFGSIQKLYQGLLDAVQKQGGAKGSTP
jgi:hypothetical protein